MNRHIALLALVSLFAILPASAILDTNENGLSDLWEAQYKVGEHLTANLDPAVDDDGDGWTNALEAIAGTDPFDPTPPYGLLNQECPYIPEHWADTDNDGDLEYFAASVGVSWLTVPGKQYTLLFSLELCDGPWYNFEQAFVGVGTFVSYRYNVNENVIKFWRVSVTDTDTDGDGLTGIEEQELGTNPTNSQTIAGIDDLWSATHFSNLLLTGGPAAIDPNADPDGDGLTNAQEATSGTNPHLADTDGDGSSDGDEVKSGHDPKSNQSYPPVWVHTQRKSFHALGYISSSRDWGGTVYHDWGSISAPGTCASLLATDCLFPDQPPDNNSHFTFEDGFAPFLVDSSGDRPHPGWSTQLTQSRFWLKTKPAPEADFKINLLRVTHRKIINADTSETILPPDIEPLEVLIHADQIFSDPIDALPTFTQTLENGKMEHVVTTLLPVELIIPKLDSSGDQIDGEFVNANELKIAKWENAFEGTGTNGSVRDDFIAWDKDRFFVRIPGGTAMGVEAVKVATEDCPDASYNDNSTRIELAASGHDDISDSMILVSDDEDDVYAGSGAGVDDQDGDRTHKVQLGGNFVIKSIIINGAEHEVNVKIPVPAKKQVDINFYRFDFAGSATEPSIRETIKWTKERYAQVGLQINDKYNNIGWPDIDGTDGPGKMSIYGNFGVDPSLRQVYYDFIDGVPNSGICLYNVIYAYASAGVAVTMKQIAHEEEIEFKYINKAFVHSFPHPITGVATASSSTTAHELLHVLAPKLEGDDHDETFPNILVTPGQNIHVDHRGRKRINFEQQKRIYNHLNVEDL